MERVSQYFSGVLNPDPPILAFRQKKSKDAPKKARISLSAEPLKFLEKKGKTHKTKKQGKTQSEKTQGNRKKQGLEGQGTERQGSGFPVPAVPVPGKTVLTVPVSGSGSVPGPSWFY